jgi:hypothetical protein
VLFPALATPTYPVTLPLLRTLETQSAPAGQQAFPRAGWFSDFGSQRSAKAVEGDGLGNVNTLWEPRPAQQQAQRRRLRLQAQTAVPEAARSLQVRARDGLISIERRARRLLQDTGFVAWAPEPEDVTILQLLRQLVDTVTGQGKNCPDTPSGVFNPGPWRAVNVTTPLAAQAGAKRHASLQRENEKQKGSKDGEQADVRSVYGVGTHGDELTECNMATLETIMQVRHHPLHLVPCLRTMQTSCC